MTAKVVYYMKMQIVGLEQRLLKEGKIKGHSQIRTFWNGLLSQPKKLEKAIGTGKRITTFIMIYIIIRV